MLGVCEGSAPPALDDGDECGLSATVEDLRTLMVLVGAASEVEAGDRPTGETTVFEIAF